MSSHAGRRKRATAALAAALGAWLFAAIALLEPATAAGSTGVALFSYTGGEQTFTVPAGVHSVYVSAVGGAGGAAGYPGNPGGLGGVAAGDLSVSPGETLYVEVGGDGLTGDPSSGAVTPGTFNGGGAAGGSGGAGGGASDVRTIPAGAPGSVASRMVVAGGGGGGAYDDQGPSAGGNGGGLTGTAGTPSPGGGAGGTQVAGGPGGTGSQSGPDGTSGILGAGGTAGDTNFGGGGGGGGFYGGGGGGGMGPCNPCSSAAGGGGGSSLVPPGGTTATASPTQFPGVDITWNVAPVITSAASATFAVGRPVSFTVTTSARPTPSLAESGAMPAGVSFIDNGDGTATLSGTPAPGSAGTYDLRITAANGVPPAAVQSFVLAVQGPPAITIANPSAGARYTRGQHVDASYSCQEGAHGTGISACRGTVASGRPISTSAIGRHSFTVTATSTDGLSTTTTVTYSVRLPSNHFAVSRIRTFADGVIAFSVRVPGPGRIDVMESAWKDNFARGAALLQPGARRFVFARALRRVTRGGTVRIKVGPNARGRDLVRHHAYPVTLRLWISFTPTGGLRHNIGFWNLHLGVG